MKPKVLLLALNGRYSHSNLALHYFLQILKTNRIDCRLVELTIKENPESLLKTILLNEWGPPTHLLLSVYIWNSTLIKILVKDLQSLAPEIKIVLGGPEVSYQWEQWRGICPDGYIIQGPGENLLEPLVTGVLEPGVHRGSSSSMDQLPFPYGEEEMEALEGRLIYYESSRGCPFQCSYCLSSCDDQPLQYRDLDQVFDELKKLAFSPGKIIKLVDRTFNSRPKRARQIWKFLVDLQGSVPFHFEIHPQFLGDDDFEILSRVPPWMFHFEIGIQSSSPTELKAVNRCGDWHKTRRNILRLQNETSIPLHLDQIVGLPGADLNSIIKSFNDILSLRPEEFQMGFLKRIPGTPLAKGPGKAMVAASEPPYKVLQTPSLSFQHFQELEQIEAFLNAYYNSGLFPRTMDLLFSSPSLYENRPYSLFQRLKDSTDFSDRVKNLQWAKLAESLWKSLKEIHPSHGQELLDSLRMDWAPLSQGQYLPSFLNFPEPKKIKEYRRELWLILKEQGYDSRDFKRGLLLLLNQGKRLCFSMPHQEKRKILFYDLPLNHFG